MTAGTLTIKIIHSLSKVNKLHFFLIFFIVLRVSLQCHEFEAWEDVIIHLIYSYVRYDLSVICNSYTMVVRDYR